MEYSWRKRCVYLEQEYCTTKFLTIGGIKETEYLPVSKDHSVSESMKARGWWNWPDQWSDEDNTIILLTWILSHWSDYVHYLIKKEKKHILTMLSPGNVHIYICFTPFLKVQYWTNSIKLALNTISNEYTNCILEHTMTIFDIGSTQSFSVLFTVQK